MPPTDLEPMMLHEAMRYSVIEAEKVSTLLVYTVSELFGVDEAQRRQVALAQMRCVHSYSLIHDDLRVWINDMLRHGKPHNSHAKSWEAVARPCRRRASAR